MRLDDNKSLLAHNAEYAAIHDIAYGVPPERQTNMQPFLEYAKTLPEFTSELLTRKIVHDDTKIHTLRQAMDEAEKIHKQARQEESPNPREVLWLHTVLEGILQSEGPGRPHHQGAHLRLWRVLQDLHLSHREGPTHGGKPQAEERKGVVWAEQTTGG